MGANPFATAQAAAIVDRQLGNAYEIVREVYDNLDVIKECGCNMTAIKTAANNMHRNILTIEGLAGALGATAVIELPAGITVDDVMDYNVLVVGTDDMTYSGVEGYFTTALTAEGDLSLTLDAGAPAAMALGTIRWTITYKTEVE